MRILKTLLYILLAIALILVLLGFIGPRSFDSSRSIRVDAPQEVVIPYITSLKKQMDWGPWKDQDPGMKLSYEGEDRTVGFKSSWEGKVAGKGTQEIVALPAGGLESELTFFMPWGESKSTGYMQTASVDGGTDITWGLRGQNGFVSRIFAVFMNMDNALGEMFDTGLTTLKSLIESDIAQEYKGYRVQVTDFPARTYVAARDKVAMDGISPFMARHLPRIRAALAQAGAEITGPPSGLYYVWDETTGTSEMATGYPVSTATTVPETEVLYIAAGKCLSVDYYGPYENTADAHLAIDEFIKTTAVKTTMPVIEEYITDPQSEPDPKKWLTRIYYLLEQ